MHYNGPVVWGVCVIGEAIRPDIPVASKERVPVARRYGAIFAITAKDKFVPVEGIVQSRFDEIGKRMRSQVS